VPDGGTIHLVLGEYVEIDLLDWATYPDEPPTFSVSGLPFGVLRGTILFLEPWEDWLGDHTFELTATTDDDEVTQTIRLSVRSEDAPPPPGVNTGPMWLPQPDLVELNPPYDWSSQDSMWPIVATATLYAAVCDEEGDRITLEVELVPDGARLREVPTHQATAEPEPYYDPDEMCATFTIPLTGMPDGRYRIWCHAVDEHGAEDPYGWVEFRSFELRADP